MEHTRGGNSWAVTWPGGQDLLVHPGDKLTMKRRRKTQGEFVLEAGAAWLAGPGTPLAGTQLFAGCRQPFWHTSSELYHTAAATGETRRFVLSRAQVMNMWFLPLG
ncbi:hypothetical protein [Spirochaeta lutea]|uniref:Uncharacterized protein n=1 Tax=Spirochaeta lutea TaxID=1480694 RepID=A0A098QSJ7_9SPIO|nr:hypothetical protein [Spirochaeta lutea]KGE70805.1 hypothetical protein DC28_15070 [Spirochaeta lutea]